MTAALFVILALLLAIGWFGLHLGLEEHIWLDAAYVLALGAVLVLIAIRMFPTTMFPNPG